jgi:antitoxin ParD1/3/4
VLYSFPNDVAQQVQGFLATGHFANEDDVLREALTVLAQQNEAVDAVRQGMAEYQAGMGRPFDEFDAEFRKEKGIPTDDSLDAMPSDLEQKIADYLGSGQYASMEEVLREAFAALDRQEADLAAIRAGLEDVEAGRYRPLEEIDAEIRKKYNFQPPA